MIEYPPKVTEKELVKKLIYTYHPIPIKIYRY